MPIYSAFKSYCEQYRDQHNIHECALCHTRVARNQMATDPSKLIGRIGIIYLCDKCVVYGAMFAMPPPSSWLSDWLLQLNKPQPFACGGIIKGIDLLTFWGRGNCDFSPEPLELPEPVELTHSYASTAFTISTPEPTDPEEIKRVLNDMTQRLGKLIDNQIIFGLRRDFEMTCSLCDKPKSECDCLDPGDILLSGPMFWQD